jgi:hypothetical protein
MRIGLIFLVLAAAARAEAAPVLVELFTSEGCSSCPPADLLLSRLPQAQPAAGAQVIALSEHVDYWNELGWIDPFSSRAFTSRQRSYAGAIRGTDVYTPQMVVDGAVAFVGSDSGKAIAAIAQAASSPKIGIGLRCASNPASLQIRIDDMGGAGADVVLAIADDGLQSSVAAGENRGRLMAHSSVARRMTVIGRARKQQPFTARTSLALDKGWKRENLSAVVFLQDRWNLRILGAARIALSACAAN